MVDIINLRKARKQAARRQQEKRAVENRVVHGRSKAECLLEHKRRDSNDRLVNQHKLQPDRE